MGSTQQVRAGAAYVELTTKNTAFIKGLEAAKKRLMEFGSATRMIGMRLFGMGTAATCSLSASFAFTTAPAIAFILSSMERS